MGMMRDALRSTRGRLVIGFVVCLLLWHAWQYLAAPGKVIGDFKPNAQGRVNVLVTLRFEPERFHVLVFQQHGRVSGTYDASIEVRGVRKDGLAAVARPYWVKRVEPLADD
jgi:hypothetical protein